MSRWNLITPLLVGLAGCAGGSTAKPLPPTQPVTGTVTLDDSPLEGALVTFIPTGNTAGVECAGKTDSEGVYVPAQTRGVEGVPAGKYKVVVSRFLRNGQPVDPNDSASAAGGILTESVPHKYSNPAMSTLTAEVQEGGGEIDFQLTTK